MSNELELTGLDGSNPLAFLAALGTLRTLSLAWPDRKVKMGWRTIRGAWRPMLQAGNFDSWPVDEEARRAHLATVIHGGLSSKYDLVPKELRDDAERDSPRNKKGEPKWRGRLAFLPPTLRKHVLSAISSSANSVCRFVEFASVWGSDAVIEENEQQSVAVKTTWDFTAGNQGFLSLADQLIDSTTKDQIKIALFAWRYSVDDVSLRWDPIDEKRRYALLPSDPAKTKDYPFLTVRGGYRLALEALPLFPAIPRGRRLEITGFLFEDDATAFTWPIWESAVTLDVLRSLLASPELIKATTDRATLSAMSVVDVFRSRVVYPSGYYRNFTPARSI